MHRTRSASACSWLVPVVMSAASTGFAGCGISDDGINCVFEGGIEFSAKLCSNGEQPTIDCDDADCVCECSDGRAPCEALEDSASERTE